MHRYTAEQQRAFSMWPAPAEPDGSDSTVGNKEDTNRHATPVFGFLADTDMAVPSRSGLVWICSPGSPCADVWPVWPRTPEYYFTLKFDTLLTERTYCMYTTTFKVSAALS